MKNSPTMPPMQLGPKLFIAALPLWLKVLFCAFLRVLRGYVLWVSPYLRGGSWFWLWLRRVVSSVVKKGLGCVRQEASRLEQQKRREQHLIYTDSALLWPKTPRR